MSMRRAHVVRPGVLMLLLLCPAAAVYGSTDLETRNTVSLTIVPDLTRKRVALTYRFEHPLREVRFEYPAQMIREDNWLVRDPGLRLEDNSIHHADGGLIEKLTIDVGLDSSSFDRVFPSLRAIGESGLVFFTYYAMLEDIPFHEIHIGVAPGSVVAYSGSVYAGSDESVVLPDASGHRGRYLYLGEAELMREIEGGFLVSDEGLPEWLVAQLRDTITSAAVWLDSYFDAQIRERVFVLATLDVEAENTRWRGDVAPNGEIFLRFQGRSWLKESAELGRVAERFLAHELVHLENGSRFQAREGEPAWLSEGLAEYLELLYIASNTPDGGGNFLADEIASKAGRCLFVLQSDRIGISDPAIQRGDPPYSCGVLAFWIVDGAGAPRWAGARLRRVWTSLVAAIEGAGRAYGVDELLLALEANGRWDEKDLLLMLIAGPADARWQDLDSMFRRLAVRVTYEYNEAWTGLARSALIRHILDLQCGRGPRGFWTRNDHVQLDTGDRCGPLSGNPRIERVQGFNVLREVRKVLTSVREACRTGGEIEFAVYESSEKVKVNCRRAMPAVPPLVVLRSDPTLIPTASQ